MVQKPVLMIHEVTEEMLTLPLHNYILTFDDGLYSQYFFYPELKKFNTEMIFFISSNIICSGQQSQSFPSCADAHKKAFAGNTEDYMTIEQIKFLMREDKVTIGAHSHNHKSLHNFSKLIEVASHISNDTHEMLDWFTNNLGFKPTCFCFPYNDDYNGIYTSLLKKAGFTDFYGRERIPIETLLHTRSQLADHDTSLNSSSTQCSAHLDVV